MSAHERIEELLPWYAAGTLEPDQRAEVDAHLTDCTACRELLGLARLLGDLPDGVTPPALLAHIHPQILTRYAEAPNEMDETTRGDVATHLQRCEDCLAALAIIRELPPPIDDPLPATEPIERTAPLQRIWSTLGTTLLRPVPALIYLVLLLIAWPAYRLSVVEPPGADHAVAATPVVVALQGEPTLRAPGAPAPPAARVPGDGAVLLRLRPDLSAEEAARGLTVVLLDGSRELWRSRVAPLDLDEDNAVPVLLDARELEVGPTYRLELRVGEAADQTVFVRRFVLERGAGAPASR